jgi:hypothetical protein
MIIYVYNVNHHASFLGLRNDYIHGNSVLRDG